MAGARWSRDRHTEKEVVCVGTVSANFEDLNHVKELPVDVAHNRNWRLHVDDIAFLHQKLLGFGAYRFNDRVGEQLLLVQAADAFVEINAGCK